MGSQIDSRALLVGATVFALLGAGVIFVGLVSLFRARPVGFILRSGVGILLVTVGTLLAGLAAGLQGYRALTREVVAARVSVMPTGAQRFSATFHFPDGQSATFPISGDEIYVDAHILKWTPLMNALGLHTSYELDRVGGRYRKLADERSNVRTVYALAPDRLIDLFDLRRQHDLMQPFVDATYGSATFATVTRPSELEVRVSTTGLMMRDTGPSRIH